MFRSITTVASACCAFWIVSFPNEASSFSSEGVQRVTLLRPRVQRGNRVLKVSGNDLLYQDQQEAMLRRAIEEQEILTSKKKLKELKAPNIKVKPPKAGTGFGGGLANDANMNPERRLAEEQAKIVRRDGLIRINNVLTPGAADGLRKHILEQKVVAAAETLKDPRNSRAYYGVENARKHRCDMQLSLRRGGFAIGPKDESPESDSHPLADGLQELLGAHGTLRPLYENLVSLQGEFYEMAAVVTDPGSNRQMVHPDLPFKSKAPLYVIFLALQDITEDMGPTSFLVKSHTAKANEIFNSDRAAQNEQLSQSDCRLATMNKGDAVLFDARILHCGNANDVSKGSTRAMFNFSFRNPEIQGNIGYAGSIMPGYVQAMTLGDIGDALDAYVSGIMDPFEKFGNGFVPQRNI